MIMSAKHLSEESRAFLARNGLIPILENREPDPKTLSRFKLRWVSLLNPCDWLYPHGLERALLAWSHVVRSAYAFKMPYYGSGPVDLIDKMIGCVNGHHYDADPIQSLADLRERFHYVLLHPWGEGFRFREWKAAADISLTGEAIIGGRHYKPFESNTFRCEADAQAAFDKLLATTDVKLNRQLNEFHKKAVWGLGVELHFSRKGRMVYKLHYSYRNDPSSWRHVLAEQMKGEPPYDTLERAIAGLEWLTKGESS